MNILRVNIFIFLAVVLSLFSVSAITNVSECGSLNVSGEIYILNQSLTTNISCFNISSSNITFDGQDYLLNGSYSINGSAIFLDNVFNVTVKNINSVGFDRTISIFGGNNNIILNSYIREDTNNSVNIVNSYLNNLTNITTINSTSYGFFIQNSSSNGLTNLVSVGSEIGLLFVENSSDNSIINPLTYSNINYNLLDLFDNNNSLKFVNIFGELKFLTRNITFLDNITSSTVNISNNYVFVNISESIELNRSANITFYNIQTNFVNPIIIKDGFECLTCYNFTSLNSGNVTFNVTSFSNYSLRESTPSLTLISPSSNYNSSRTYIEVNVSTSDDFTLDTIRIYLFNTTALVNNTNISISGTVNSTYINFVGLANTRYYVNVTINDSRGRTNYSITKVIGVDTVAPTIWDISEGNPDTDSNVIEWNTNEVANATIYYSTSSGPDSGNSVKYDNTVELNHSITISNLDSDTKYYYEVRSCDTVGNCATSNEDNYFTTDADSTSTTSSSSSDNEEDTSFWTKDFIYSDKEIKDKGTITTVVQMGERARIKLDNKYQYFGMIRVRSSSVTFNITSISNPQSATLKINESKDFELTGDSFFDVRIKLENIINSTHANLSIRYVHESTGVVTLGSSGSNGSISNSTLNATNLGEEDALNEDEVTYADLIKPWMYIVVGSMIAVGGLSFAIYKFMKSRGNLQVVKKRVKVKHP